MYQNAGLKSKTFVFRKFNEIKAKKLTILGLPAYLETIQSRNKDIQERNKLGTTIQERNIPGKYTPRNEQNQVQCHLGIKISKSKTI